MIAIFNNKNSLISQKPRNLWLLIISIICLLSYICYYIIKTPIYDNYQTKAIVACSHTPCTITSIIPLDINVEYIALNNKRINYEIVTQELKIDEENFLSYYEIVLKTDEELEDKSIINLNFYYNKQRMIAKLLEKMF